MKRTLLSIIICLSAIGVVATGNSQAQQQDERPNVKVSLALTNSRVTNPIVYLLDNPATPQLGDPDPIEMVITLKNEGGTDIYTSEGFQASPFHLFLIFTDPNNKPITTYDLSNAAKEDPPPPKVIPVEGNLVQVEAIETLRGDPAWALSIIVPNAHAFYTLSRPGNYSVKALIPMRTYHTINHPGPPDYSELDAFKWSGALHSNTVNFILAEDKDKDGYSFPVAVSPPYHDLPDCDDSNPYINPGMAEVQFNGIDEDCNPLTIDGAEGRGMVIVKVDIHKVGTGTQPGSTKQPPRVPMPIRIFDKFSSCVAPYSASWQNYEAIWACPSATVYCYPSGTPVDRCQTDGSGISNMIVPPGNYIAIGKYSSTVYTGVSVGGVEAGQTVSKYLQIIEKADGKKVPAKYTTKTGSELMIIEPEYIEWSGTRELYPFIFESVGAWGVTTSVYPPEGFVADFNNLSTNVNTELKALQFTITDVGTKWKPTKVQHKLKHKGSSETVRSQVGIKLTKELARKKGVTVYGEPLKK